MTDEQKERLKQIRAGEQTIKTELGDMLAIGDANFLLSLVDEQGVGIGMNRVGFASVSDAASPDVFCPQCGGTKPTCCRCPDEAVGARGTSPSTAISVIEQLYNEWWDNDRRRCLDTILARLKSLPPERDTNDAATRMRSACVEKVQEILNGLMIELPPVSDSYLKGQGWNSALARANNEIMPALEAVTLDQQQEKQSK